MLIIFSFITYFWNFEIIHKYSAIRSGNNVQKKLISQRMKINETTQILSSLFFHCINSEKFSHGGALFVKKVSFIIDNCIFDNNSAEFSGSIEIDSSFNSTINNSLIIRSSAERFGGILFDGANASCLAFIYQTNFSQNSATKWIGAIRLQHNGGQLNNCYFTENSAENYGAIFDFGHYPSNRLLSHCFLKNNTALIRAGGFTSFHLLYNGQFTSSIFIGNSNREPYGKSIFVFSDSSIVKLFKCTFDGPKSEQVIAYFSSSKLEIDQYTTFSGIFNESINKTENHNSFQVKSKKENTDEDGDEDFWLNDKV